MTDLQILIFLIVALLAAVAYWAHIGKDKIPIWAANLVLFTLYSSWCKYLMIEGPGDGGKSFAALMLWFLLLIVHILVALIVIVALRINKKTE